MRRYRTLILEDEPPARNRLIKLLEPYQDRIELCGEADNGAKGLRLIEEIQPDLLFLDIQMPVLSGFEVLERLSYSPRVIFTTAYDEFALRAFQENTIDYLLKPIHPERLEHTIQKLDQLSTAKDRDGNLEQLKDLMTQFQPEAPLNSLTVTLGDRMVLIKPEEIVFLQASDKYVELHTISGQKYLVDYSLTTLEKRLNTNFLRIHRSYIINSDHLREIRKGFNGKWTFFLQGKEEYKLTSGSSYLPELRRKLAL